MKPTRHAIKRYIERVKPTMDAVQAREDLDRMIPLGQWIPRPEWIKDHPDIDRTDQRYFELVEGIVLVCAGPEDNVTTVMTRGEFSPEDRAAKSAYKRRKRQAKKAKNRNQSDPRTRV